MDQNLAKMFLDGELTAKICRKLPRLFSIAQLEASRAKRAGMQVGSLRENIIIAMLIYKFGEENVITEIPITKKEVDVILYGNRISIKTITGLGGVKLIWTVDAIKAREFIDNYTPEIDMLLILIRWNEKGGFYYIPVETQRKIFESLGKERYFRPPKPGTNPRGVEIRREALSALLNDDDTHMLELFWEQPVIEHNPYKRWIDYWAEN